MFVELPWLIENVWFVEENNNEQDYLTKNGQVGKHAALYIEWAW